MAISYVQSFPPKWYIVKDDGTSAGGAQLFTYDHLTRDPKAVYQDPGGNLAWPNPLTFDANGTKGPIYWRVDDADPDDSYYIEVYDANGELLWTEDEFPSASGGGGSNVTTYIPLTNYITNNQFIDNIGSAGPLPTNLVICPSNHKGFTPALINPITGTFGVLGPDIRFVKNNTNAVDNVSFVTFALGSAPLTGDVTPVGYLRYQCSNSPAGETYKCFQFPITQKVKNLSNQPMTFGVWAAVTATPVTISAYCRQYYGSGTGATPESGSTRTLIGNMNLTTAWTWFPLSFTVPNVAAGTLGSPGLQTNDDAVYIQLQMPLGTPCDVLFTKPALFLGSIDPDLEFEAYDMIDSIDQTPRTGDVKVSYWSSPPGGWVAMNDGSIGNSGSSATNRANSDTFQLYKTLWDGVSNTWAPVSGGRGATALADFLANKTLTLPRALGRSLASAGAGSGLTSRALGQFLGEETHLLTIGEIPSHNHPGSTVNIIISGSAGGGGGNNTVIGAASAVNVAAQGGGAAHNNMPPTTYANVFIKL